ncbi:MAG: hypothetical protein CM15mP18_2550 [Methanobacteriota archaeon]|nr:MAG: hypothetical protein CM15mP18_2550 [Euryarchaeota archaeon]
MHPLHERSTLHSPQATHLRRLFKGGGRRARGGPAMSMSDEGTVTDEPHPRQQARPKPPMAAYALEKGKGMVAQGRNKSSKKMRP